MLRSRATAACEPCQGLTAAALNKMCRVPRGSFNGVNRRENASVRVIKDGAQYSKTDKRDRLSVFEFASSTAMYKHERRVAKTLTFGDMCVIISSDLSRRIYHEKV